MVSLPWLITTGTPSVRRCIKASKEKRAVGVKKPQKAQKAKVLWKMKAAKEREKNTATPPTREDNIKGRNETKISTLGRTLQRSNWCAGQSPDVCGKQC